ncbi:MAG: gliding motility-associated C-terminal domain-containing protein, partial [Cyclobacteriaceae bacterium]
EDLQPGDYQVLITNTVTECTSSLIYFTIDNQAVDPVIVLTASSDDTSCKAGNEGNGLLTVGVENGVGTTTTTGYTFTWYRSTTTSAVNQITAPAGGNAGSATVNGSGIDNLSADTYTVVVTDTTDPNNTCTTTASFVLGEDLKVISITSSEYTITPSDNCDFNGALEITDVLEDGASQGLANYSFTWNAEGGGAHGGALASTGAGTNNRLEDLQPGDYQVLITNTVTACTSSLFFFTIEDNAVDPVVVLATSNEDSSCQAGNSGNGSMSVAIQDGVGSTTTTGYTFTWFRSTNTADPDNNITASGANAGSATASGASISNLSADTYTVVVTDTTDPNNTCTTTASFVLGEDLKAISIASNSAAKIANNNCALPFNGSYEITDVLEDGASQGLANYSFTWNAEGGGAHGGALVSTGAGANNKLEDLQPGDYQVLITNTVTACASSLVYFTIEEDAVDPIVVFTQLSPSTFCGGGNNGNGSLKVEVQQAVGSLTTTGHTFVWYRGSSATPGNELTDPGTMGTATVVAGTNNTEYNGLSAGIYTVVATDTSDPNNTCETTASFNLSLDTPEITLTSSDYSKTNNVNCYNLVSIFGTGTIDINQVRVDGTVTTNLSDFTFTWSGLPAGSSVNNVNGTGDQVTGLTDGTYSVSVQSASTGCSTGQDIEITIKTETIEPSIAFVMTENEGCNAALPGIPNGTLTASVTEGGNTFAGTGRFSFAWYNGTTTVTPISGTVTNGTGASDNTSEASELAAGNYTLEVTDNETGCSTIGTFNVGEILDIPTLKIPGTRLTASTICTAGVGNGAITLVDADITPGNLSDYDLTWYLNPPPGVAFDTQLGTDGDVGQQTNLQAGDYYVVATNRTTGCASASVRFDIEDFTTIPVLEFSQTPDIGCGATLGLGSITALADGFQSSNAPAGYSWQWYEGSSTAFPTVDPADGGQSSTITNQSFGTYTVVVTDGTTGCSATQRVDLEKEERYPIVTGTTSGSQTQCNPNGTVAVTQVTYDGASVALTNFTFSWTTKAGAPLGGGTSPATSGSLPAGSYLVTVTHNTTGCVSQQTTEVVVLDEIALPDISISQDIADTNCSAPTGTGQLSASADGGFTANPPYTFEWFNGSSATGTAFATTATISSLSAGTYTVRVSNSNTGCNDTKSFELESEPIKPKIVSTSITAATVCNTGNGEIAVTAMQPDNVNSYTYELYDVKPSTVGAVAIDNSNNGQFTNVNVGTFWVVATHITTECGSPAVQVEVEDESIPPVIAQESIVLQTNCDPAIPNGTMTVSADGSTDPALYSFEWYEGALPVSGNPADVISNTAEVTDLAAGIYSVVVTDLTTGCSNEESFRMADDIDNPILISTSFEANFNCVNPDGEMSMFIINAQANKDYEYYWFIGNVTNPDINNADYQGVSVINIPNGTYTAYAIDVTGGCESDPVVIEVPDNTNTNDLQFDLIQDEPLTNCDPNRPNAIVSINYTTPPGTNDSKLTFYWYTGIGTDPANRIDETVSTYTRDGLRAEPYTVEMIDESTGCSISKTIAVDDETQNAPTPLINVVTDRTNCLTPNGEAIIVSDLLDFTFEWRYNGSFFGNGSAFTNLDVGDYEVIATNIVTGCTSVAATFPIVDKTVQDPEFDYLITQQPVCDLNNGEVETIGLEEIDSIAWSIVSTVEPGFSTGLYSNDRKLIEAPPGEYSVYIRDGFGCDNTLEFTMGTDIIIYNGVSANGDGQNDIFLIDCAEFFPNNKCQIFNRSGQKVYEIDNYDNINNVFVGISNKGVSVGKEGLPEGTYFYIFDKGDGSDVHQGYLELVR